MAYVYKPSPGYAMKYMCNDMSHRKLTHLASTPGTVPQHLSVLLEDDYPLSQGAYSNILRVHFPYSDLVLSHSPQQTYQICTMQPFDLILIDQKGPTLSTATTLLLSALPAETSVIIISALRRPELEVHTASAIVTVIEKPITLEALTSALRKNGRK